MNKTISIHPVPELISQPDGYSCGATAAKMMLNVYAPANDLTLEEVKQLFLTNPATGTTHEGMINGLTALEIPYTRTFQAEKPFELVDEALKQNKLFLMRTAIHGCKHWLLVYGKDKENYLIADPMGRYWVCSKAFMDEIWGCREYDGFIIEKSFNDETVEIRKIEPHEVDEALLDAGFGSFKDKIGGTANGFYNSVMWAMESLDNAYVAVYRNRIIGGYFLEFNKIGSFYLNDSGENYKDKVGIQGVALFLLPEFRGQGIGAALRAIPVEMEGVDYVWGMHLASLKNVKNWVKYGRKVISGSEDGFAVTLMDLNEQRRKNGTKTEEKLENSLHSGYSHTA